MTGITLLGMDDTIGNRIRRLRKAREWNQEKLAVVAMVSSSTVSRLERGGIESDIGTIERIAQALDVDAAELMGHDAQAAQRRLYPSLQAFLDLNPRLKVTPSERAWLARPLPDDRDIGDNDWWMSLLLAYRQQQKLAAAGGVKTESEQPRRD